jgi:hypothetical protein
MNTSVAEPGACGTISRIGRSGKFCALAGKASSTAAQAAAAQWKNGFMVSSPHCIIENHLLGIRVMPRVVEFQFIDSRCERHQG